MLGAYGLRLKRKIRIMGPSAIKLLTGPTGARQVRAPKEKLSRIRSGIHKLRSGLVSQKDGEKYIKGLVGQLRFIHQLCPDDTRPYAKDLLVVGKRLPLTEPDLGSCGPPEPHLRQCSVCNADPLALAEGT